MSIIRERTRYSREGIFKEVVEVTEDKDLLETLIRVISSERILSDKERIESLEDKIVELGDIKARITELELKEVK